MMVLYIENMLPYAVLPILENRKRQKVNDRKTKSFKENFFKDNCYVSMCLLSLNNNNNNPKKKINLFFMKIEFSFYSIS